MTKNQKPGSSFFLRSLNRSLVRSFVKCAICTALVGFVIAIPGCKEEQASAVSVPDAVDSVETPVGEQTTESDDATSKSGDAPDDATDKDDDTAPEIAATPLMRRPPPQEQIGAPEPKSRQRSTLRRGGVRDIIFDDLEFEIEPDQHYEPEMLTDKIRKLDGKKVILRGFMDSSSIFQRKGIKQFVLIRDNSICCFGPGAKIYHNVQIDMDGKASAEFPGLKPMEIEGKFSIKPWTNPGDGKVYSVFHILATKAK